MNNETLMRWLWSLGGGIVALLAPTLPYILIYTLAVILDMITAWSLARRAAKLYPDKVHEWKLTSVKMGRIFTSLLKGYALIVLAHLVHVYITDRLGFSMVKVVSGALVFWQVWSILENESSCNGAAWAKTLQRVLVDKTSRHFDVDLSDLENRSLDAHYDTPVESTATETIEEEEVKPKKKRRKKNENNQTR